MQAVASWGGAHRLLHLPCRSLLGAGDFAEGEAANWTTNRTTAPKTKSGDVGHRARLQTQSPMQVESQSRAPAPSRPRSSSRTECCCPSGGVPETSAFFEFRLENAPSASAGNQSSNLAKSASPAPPVGNGLGGTATRSATTTASVKRAVRTSELIFIARVARNSFRRTDCWKRLRCEFPCPEPRSDSIDTHLRDR